MQKKIIVYENFSSEKPKILGLLYVDAVRGKEQYSFEYTPEWLKSNSGRCTLDPDLSLYKGRQFPIDKNAFGLFADSSPDRWGRMLMDRRERFLADKENRKPRKLTNSDYLLGVYDDTRMGAIRFKLDEAGSFLADDQNEAVPPWTTLRTLEEASRRFENEGSVMDERWLNQLLKPGSSLGGARPKATVIDPEGNLWIAKFPSRHDEYNIAAWEKVAHDLAELCGLNVPPAKLETFSSLGGTFLVRRFDRERNRRIHFASAMTMLGRTDGSSAEDGASYLDLVSFLRANGAAPKEDMFELWKRVVFSIAISNTDDHLRNHGFILTGKGWRLSPLYDVNPVPYGDSLSLNIDENNCDMSMELAIDTAAYFGIAPPQAEATVQRICDLVKDNWERMAEGNGISRGTIEYMRPAFAACYS